MPNKNLLASRLHRREWLFDIIMLATLLLVFYTIWLGSYALFTPDEGRYSEVAREMVASGDYITPRVDGVAFLDKPVLYYWLQAAAINLFGLKEWALRLFPALFGIMGSLLVYASGRRLFDRRTGLIAGAILATSPLWFCCGHYANLDLEVATLISGVLLSFITAMQSEGKTRTCLLFACYIFAALAFLTKGLIGFAFPGMIAGAWMILLWRWDILRKIHLFSGIALITALVVPWYYLVQKANPEFLHFFFVTQQVDRFLSAETFNNATPFWFYLPIVAAGFFPWIVFVPQALNQHLRNVWRARKQYQTELFLLLWLFIVFIFFSIPKSKTISYILPVFPPLALLTGSYLSSVWNNARRPGILFGAGALITIAFLLSAGLYASRQNEWIYFPEGFSLYLSTLIAILLCCGTLTLLVFRQKTVRLLFSICLISSMFVLLTATRSATYLNENTAKPLAINLKQVIQPQDEVVTYFKYFHDVPLYLGRRVTIVADWNSPEIPRRDNWQRELWYGMAFQKTGDWLINEDTFWKRWDSNKRMFVFVNVNYFSRFKKHNSHYYLMQQYRDIILLTN